MDYVGDFDRAVTCRMDDIVTHPSKRTIPSFTTFFIGTVFGILISRLACICIADNCQMKKK